MSVLRYVLVAVAAGVAVACIVVGIVWIDPPDRAGGEESTFYALGDGIGIVMGWWLIALGGGILCVCALALVFGRRPRHAEPPAPVEAAAQPLPGARARVRPRDEDDVKTRGS